MKVINRKGKYYAKEKCKENKFMVAAVLWLTVLSGNNVDANELSDSENGIWSRINTYVSEQYSFLCSEKKQCWQKIFI